MPANGLDSLVGKIGRVTGTIRSGEIGEVMLPYRGGTNAFHAYSADPEISIPVGEYVLVVECRPPQTVLVDIAPDFLRPPGV